MRLIERNSMWTKKVLSILPSPSASASFCPKSALSCGRSRPNSIGFRGYFGGKIVVDSNCKGFGYFRLPGGGGEQFFVGFAGEETEFKQNRWNIGRLQDHETRRAQWLAGHEGQWP